MEINEAQELIKANIQTIENLDDETYPFLYDYLKPRAPLRKTFLTLMEWLSEKNIILDGNPKFFVTTDQLTMIRLPNCKNVRNGHATSNRHLNMLAAMGMFHKEPQYPQYGKALRIVQDYYDKTGKRSFGVFRIIKYNEQNLEAIEDRCLDLKTAGITAGNIQYDMFAVNGLKELGQEIYYANSWKSADNKKKDYDDLMKIMADLIAEHEYTTNRQIRGQWRASHGAYKALEVRKADNHLKKIMRIYKAQINDQYQHKPPKDEDMEKYGLVGRDWIWIARNN